MSRFTILLGGEVAPTPRLMAQLAGTRVIAADAGIGHARPLGLVPEFWVGDFDSIPNGLPDEFDTIERKTFPRGKNYTDGELAVEEALERGASELILVGAFGGPRVDHAFLHIALSARLREDGIQVLLTSGAQEGTPLNSAADFDYADGTVFSIIAFDDLFGLTVTGARWPLDNFDMPFGSSRTISNEVQGSLRVELRSGRAILIAHPYPVPGF